MLPVGRTAIPTRAQGLQLRRGEAAAALTMRREIGYGLAAILLVTPLLGLLVAQLPLQPRPLAFGLGVVCAVPTALACGVAFVQVGAAAGLSRESADASSAAAVCVVGGDPQATNIERYYPPIPRSNSAATCPWRCC